MSVKRLLHKLCQERVLAVPKAEYSRNEVLDVVGDCSGETQDAWLVPCSHLLRPPAKMAYLSDAEQRLGIAFPPAFVSFLLEANGAKLYVVTYAWLQDVVPEAQHPRYHVFGIDDLVDVNQSLLRTFRHSLGDDVGFASVDALNYLAFCDAHNGNYLAFLTDGPDEGKIFFLDHEYSFRPFSTQDADLYYTVAEAFEAWLEILITTKGWGGIGSMHGGL